MEQENTVYKAIQSIGVNVDKDELIRALKYDRDQYDKGFDDGKKQTAKEIISFISFVLSRLNIGWLCATF